MNMSERRLWRLTSPKSHELAPPLERAEQAVVMDWANMARRQWPELRFLFAVPNGELRHRATAALLVRQGVKPGVPDLIFPVPRNGYVGLAIEMKRKPNRPTDLQQAWLDGLDGFGWQSEVCYTATEAISVLEAYVTARPTVIA